MSEENTQLATQSAPASSALAVMGQRLNVDPKKLHKTLKATVFKECKTDEEMLALCIVANEYGLNPIVKEMYAFPAKGGGVEPMIAVDGWITIMLRQPTYEGHSVKITQRDEHGKPLVATCVIHRTDKEPLEWDEDFEECFQKHSPNWQARPARMLKHQALKQAVRQAFGISGLYDEDDLREMERMKEARTASAAGPAQAQDPKALPPQSSALPPRDTGPAQPAPEDPIPQPQPATPQPAQAPADATTKPSTTTPSSPSPTAKKAPTKKVQGLIDVLIAEQIPEDSIVPTLQALGFAIDDITDLKAKEVDQIMSDLSAVRETYESEIAV